MADQRYESALRLLAALTRRAELIGAMRYDDIVDLLEMLKRDPCSSGLAKALEASLDDVEETHRISPNCLAAPPETEDLFPPGNPPDIIIGETTETGVPYGPRVDDARLIAITGVPGGGKTTTVGHIVRGILAFLLNVAVLMFDPKADTTCLLAFGYPNLRIVKAHEIRINPLRPPAGMDLRGWLNIVATHFCAIRGLIKSKHLLLDAMLYLCEVYGVDKDRSRPWPSPFDVLEYLVRLPKTFGKDDYRQSMITELRGLLDESGDLFNTSDGIDIERDMLVPGGLFALQIELLPVSAQQFLISIIVEHIIHDGIVRNIRNVGLERLVVLDEAQLILSRAADLKSANGLAPLASQLLRGRELGVGFVVVAHLLTEISRAVLASAKTMLVVGGLSDAGSIDVAAHMMSLPMTARTMFPRLGRGQVIVREIGAGAYTDAFLVDIDAPVVAKDAIDEPTRQRLMAPHIESFPASPSVPLSEYPAVMAELKPIDAVQNELDILRDAIRHRDDWHNERRVRMKVSEYVKFDAACESLENQKLLIIHPVRLGRTTYCLLEVTDKGFAADKQSKPVGYIGHGGFVHTVLISRIAAHLQKTGWTKVKTEHPVGPQGHPVDVFGVSPTGVPTAFEVTLSTSNVVSNALKTLSAPTAVQTLIFLCRLDKDCTNVERMLKKDPAVKPFLQQIQVERIDRHI